MIRGFLFVSALLLSSYVSGQSQNDKVLATLLTSQGLEIIRRGLPSGSFVYPNEVFPKDFKTYLDPANAQRTYVSVGGDRSFFGAAFARAKKLKAIDQDVGVLTYLSIVTLLFKISRSHEDFLWLRNKANIEEWVRRISEAKNLNPLEKSFLGHPDIFQFFKREIRERANHSFELLRGLSVARGDAFDGTYYLDQSAYEHIKDLADSDNIHIVFEDLRRFKPETPLDEDSSFGILDLSNVWQERYMSAEEFVSVLKSFREMYDIHSQLILSTNPAVSMNKWRRTGPNTLIAVPQRDYIVVPIGRVFAELESDILLKNIVGDQKGHPGMRSENDASRYVYDLSVEDLRRPLLCESIVSRLRINNEVK